VSSTPSVFNLCRWRSVALDSISIILVVGSACHPHPTPGCAAFILYQGRLRGLREVLERYTEDDQDMYRMCLTKMREQVWMEASKAVIMFVLQPDV